MKRKPFFLLLLSGLFLLFVAEVVLRMIGLRQFPLYLQHGAYEYIYLPDQDVEPRGVNIRTNDLGLRSKTLGKTKKRKRVLVIGDSVVNGSYAIEQSQLATSLLEEMLPDAIPGGADVINLSMNSWGPDNGAAFIKEHGSQDPDLIVLVVSSHDAHDNMTFEPWKEGDPSYPKEKPTLALTVLWQKLLLKFQKEQERDPKYLRMKKPFNDGFRKLKTISDSLDVPMAIYLHYETPELKAGLPDGRGQEILAFAGFNRIPMYHGIQMGEEPSLYSDIIHLNVNGQRTLAQALLKVCVEQITDDHGSE